MPDFIVWHVLIPIAPDTDVAAAYANARSVLGQYLFQCRLEGDASALGMYLQTLLSWPSAPYRTELCIHRKRLSKDSDEFVELPVDTIPGLPEDRVYSKERWLIDVVREEMAQGRGVAIFVRQTGERNIQPRIAKLLTDHIPGAKPFILKGNVKADQREAVLDKQLSAGTNILICNLRLVQTGLDLCALPTIIFFEVDYSLYVMGQASRRAWRLIQNRPCKVFYSFYEHLMENQAVELIGRKQQAAALLYGESTGTGLSALNGEDGGNLLAALAAEIGSDNSVTDLRDLFARHAAASDPAESAWFSAEVEEPAAQEVTATDVVEMATAVVEPQLSSIEEDPLLTMLTQELGGTITEITSMPARAVLPPRPVYKRRRKVVDMLAVPDEVPVGASQPPQRTHRALLAQKFKLTPHQQETLQLSLF
jgi:hypothetical protein